MQNTIDRINELTIKLTEALQVVQDSAEIVWEENSAKAFCEKQGFQVLDDVARTHTPSNDVFFALNSFNYGELQSKLNATKVHLLSNYNVNFNECNEPYRTHVKNMMDSLSVSLERFLMLPPVMQNAIGHLSNFINRLKSLQNELNYEINELYENFKYGNRNYVIFGKNGAGKTTLLKKISSSILTSSVVIPANRRVDISTSSHVSFNTTIKYNQMLAEGGALFYLAREINNKSLKEYEQGNVKNSVVSSKLYNIFNDLGLEREIIIEREAIFLKAKCGKAYSLVGGSDGEKSIAYIIMAVLLAEKNSYIFIDEPERHLNGALMRNLFNILEAERQDLRFIYLTHVIDFIESRKNIELIYLEKTNEHNKWKFKKIEDHGDISLDVILSIEGRKEDIIFCEGDRSSIDCKILECLYPEYEIKPVGSCKDVRKNTIGINEKEAIFRRKAFGLIDNDYMIQEEIDSLKANRIIAIGYNEWENFLISSKILDYVNSSHLEKDINKIKEGVIKHIKTQNCKDSILSDFITKRYYKMMHSEKLSYSDALSDQIDKINSNNKSKLIAEVNNLKNQIENSNDYDELVAIVPAKMLLSKVAKGIGLNFDKDYVDLLVKLLKTDKEFNDLVKVKLNLDFTI